MEWQALTADHGCVEPAALEDIGAARDWRLVMARSRELHAAMARETSPAAAQYAVAMAYRIRYRMQMNAREAMHVIELRTTPQGHPSYRRVCQAMHRLIADEAGHRAIAEAMRFADHSAVELERLGGERASERRRAERGRAGAAISRRPSEPGVAAVLLEEHDDEASERRRAGRDRWSVVVLPGPVAAAHPRGT